MPPLQLRIQCLGVVTFAALYLCVCVPGHPLHQKLHAGGVAQLRGARPAVFAVVLKVLPILSLGLQCAWISRASLRDHSTQRYAALVAAGLVVSSVGDVLLETRDLGREAWWGLSGDTLFAAGLAAFLLAHLIYIVALAARTGRASAALALAAAAACVGSVGTLWAGTPSFLRAPIAVYSATISAMGYYAAVAAPHRGDVLGSRCGLLGALLFMLSDSALGLHTFGPPLARKALAQHGKLLVMVTYYAAQTLIASSVRLHGDSAEQAAEVVSEVAPTKISETSPPESTEASDGLPSSRTARRRTRA